MQGNPRWADVPAVVNELARDVIGIAIDVHASVGPGLLEAPYKLVLAQRLRSAGHHVVVEQPLRLEADGIVYNKVYRADLVVNDVLLVEIKAVPEITFPMVAQTKTYLRLGGWPLGLILNFHPPRLYLGGIKRVVP